MRFDFISDEANDILELCERAEKKKNDYIKNLGRSVSKKELDEITERFVREELNLYGAEKNKQSETIKNESEKTSFEYPDITKDYKIDSLEFDEIQDMLDDDFDDM